MGLEPRSHVNQFQIDLYMAPNSIGAFLFKHQREKVKDPQAMITILIVLHGAQRQLLLLKQTLFLNIKKDSNNKRTSFCPDISTMSRTLLNKRILYMAPNLREFYP